MLLELHILQNFAPSNLNRDDTGSPKDCEFGGYRRARISSQCLKRAVRQAMKADGLLPADDLAARTKRLVEELTKRLVAAGKDAVVANGVAKAALNAAGLKVETNEKTQYLLFLGQREIAAIAAFCLDKWDALLPAVDVDATTTNEDVPTTGRGKKKAPKTQPVDPALGNAMKGLLNGGRAADLALFGRMIADLPDKNVDGSCQVAHALSTNAVNVEFDFYTAVDDLKATDTAGADMLGTIEFNSACYYRYANLDVRQLAGNLDGDLDLTRRSVEAFLRAAVSAIQAGNRTAWPRKIHRRSFSWSRVSAASGRSPMPLCAPCAPSMTETSLSNRSSGSMDIGAVSPKCTGSVRSQASGCAWSTPRRGTVARLPRQTCETWAAPPSTVSIVWLSTPCASPRVTSAPLPAWPRPYERSHERDDPGPHTPAPLGRAFAVLGDPEPLQ